MCYRVFQKECLKFTVSLCCAMLNADDKTIFMQLLLKNVLMTTMLEKNCSSIPVLRRVHEDIERKDYIEINVPVLMETEG